MIVQYDYIKTIDRNCSYRDLVCEYLNKYQNFSKLKNIDVCF